MEEWKDISGFEGGYQVSNYGAIRSLNRTIVNRNGKVLNLKAKFIRPRPTSGGYMYVQLGRTGNRSVHRMVAEHFIDGDKNLHVNHIDSDPTNNRVENLEWVTIKENNHHARNKGRMLNASNDCRATDDMQKLTLLTLTCIMREKEIFDRFKLNPKYIGDIRRGKTSIEFKDIYNEHCISRQKNFAEQKREVLL